MMRKIALAVGIIIIVLAVSILAVGYYWSNQPKQIDTSWVAAVRQYLDEAKPYPANEILLNYYQIFLSENGSEQIVQSTSVKTNLVTYLETLTGKVNTQINNMTINEEFVYRVLKSDTVVTLQYRFSQFSPSKTVVEATFILEDKLNEGLKGKIILNQSAGERNFDYKFSLWAIAK